MTQRERGQVIPLTAIAAATLLGAAALAIDVGYWWYQQRMEQTAADSAAVAGTIELAYSAASSALTAAARADATLNGFTDDGGTTVSVTVNNPPLSGAYAGNADAVEAIVQRKLPAFFSGIFGHRFQWVSARAVAVETTVSRDCIYALAPSGNSVLVNGAQISAPECGIISDGSALFNGANVTAQSIGYAAATATVNGSTFAEGQPQHALAVSDPCSTIPGCAYLKAHPPTSGSCTTPTIYNGLSSVTIAPGVYCSQVIVNGCSNVVFSPGVFTFENGMMINGASNVSGSGVTFYNEAGQLVINGSSVTLTAPATGNTAGMVVYQVASDASSFILNGSGGGYAGGLYFPGAQLTINGALSNWLLVVGNTVLINGSGIDVPNAAFPGVIGHVVLAE